MENPEVFLPLCFPWTFPPCRPSSFLRGDTDRREDSENVFWVKSRSKTAEEERAQLTFLQAPLCGREHLVHSEGVGSFLDTFVLHLLDVRQAVHGAAEVSLPGLWVGPVHTGLVFTCRRTLREMYRSNYSISCSECFEYFSWNYEICHIITLKPEVHIFSGILCDGRGQNLSNWKKKKNTRFPAFFVYRNKPEKCGVHVYSELLI